LKICLPENLTQLFRKYLYTGKILYDEESNDKRVKLKKKILICRGEGTIVGVEENFSLNFLSLQEDVVVDLNH
jgi:hypothetical protein